MVGSLSLGPVTAPRELAHYMVVEFQPRAEDTQTLDSGQYLRVNYVGLLIAVVPPPLPLPPEIPPPDLCVFRHFVRACISLSASCLLSARIFI